MTVMKKTPLTLVCIIAMSLYMARCLLLLLPKNRREYEAYQFQFQVNRVEAGYPEYVSEGKKITLYFITGETGEDSIGGGAGWKYYLIKAFYDSDIYNIWDNPGENLIIKPRNNSDLWFLPVKPGVQLDLETPELAGLQDELELLQGKPKRYGCHRNERHERYAIDAASF